MDNKIPFQLRGAEHDGLATHLMIMLPGPLSDCANIPSPNALTPLLHKGWSLAFAGDDGRQTDWTSGRDAWKDACGSAAGPTAVHDDSLQWLASQPGRRVLLFIGSPDKQALMQAKTILPEIYILDGGVPLHVHVPILPLQSSRSVSNPSQPSPEIIPPPSPQVTELANLHWQAESPSRNVHQGPRQEGLFNGAMHVKSLTSAVHAMRKASDLYYDLSFSMPPSVTASTPLQLKFRFIDDFSARCELYSEEQGADLRSQVATPLVVLP
jgi:hypothetical protein